MASGMISERSDEGYSPDFHCRPRVYDDFAEARDSLAGNLGCPFDQAGKG
jgi:hypothetical protein